MLSCRTRPISMDFQAAICGNAKQQKMPRLADAADRAADVAATVPKMICASALSHFGPFDASRTFWIVGQIENRLHE